MLKKLTEIVIRYPIITIVLTLLLTCFFFYGLTKVEVSADVKDMLPADDKRVMTFEEVDKKFGGADFIMLALETEDIFTYQTLKSVDNLTREIGELEWVSSVRSITNTGEIKGVEYGLEVLELIDEIPDDVEELKKLKNRILSNKNAVGVTVSEDGRVAVIVIQMQPDSNGKEALQELDEVLAKSDYDGTIHQIGLPVMEKYVGTAVREDMKLLIPFVVLVVILVLFLSFRNLRGVLLPLSVAGISTIWTLGLMGFLKVPLSNVSNIIPIVLIGVGTAYAIHILSYYSDEHDKNNKKESSENMVMKTMEIVALAIMLAAITTMIGFAANFFSPLNPIRETGVFTAFGVLAAFLISITLIPAI
ncbi:MMPL family transporter, partial [Candidatus Pacearchaeota archaeon]|nr:MMPL family transporter [Candidatus Pacearchaeota archaeon]